MCHHKYELHQNVYLMSLNAITNYNTMPSHKLHKAAQINKMLSMVAMSFSEARTTAITGNGPFKIRYLFFNNPITRSTCMRTLEIFLYVSTSLADICVFPYVKAAVITLAPLIAKASWTSL